MAEKFLAVDNLAVQIGGKTILRDIRFTIYRNQPWAITGRSGSGKTLLAEVLAGRHSYQGQIDYFFTLRKNGNSTIQLVTQQHRFKNLSNTSDLYYQQRFNSYDAEQTITVMQELRQHIDEGELLHSPWIDALHIRRLLDEPLIQLSTGENKRLQLVIALMADPELMILDNPFVGLDPEGRDTLHRIMEMISKRGIQILLITTPSEIPAAFREVAFLENGSLERWDKIRPMSLQHGVEGENILDQKILDQLKYSAAERFINVVSMKNVTVRYGEKTILNHISWTLKKGECWNLSGPNGAGKSTLLSLITADNPQAYANEIYLFDKRRGSGESIWDIKRKIGFVSPELHLYFDRSASCFEVIASGLFDTIGLFRHLTAEQEERVTLWLQLFRLESLRSKGLAQISLSEQRRTLLARSLIKMPPLLILDEPCQALDEEQTVDFTRLVDQICRASGTSLIYVSHYANQIPACVNHFLRLEHGELV